MSEENLDLQLPRTDRLELRLFQDSDALEITKLMTPGLSQWLASWPPNVSEIDALEKISGFRENTLNKRSLAVAIVRVEDNKFLGSLIVKVGKTNPELGEIGYWIGEQYQGKGYLKEVLDAFVDCAFSYLGITTLQAGAQLENKSSFVIMEKMGMASTGTRSIYVPSRDRHEEVLYYTLSRPIASA